MAEGDTPATEAEGTARRVIDLADHPLLFALAITFIVIAMSAFLYMGAQRLGWTGLASLFR